MKPFLTVASEFRAPSAEMKSEYENVLVIFKPWPQTLSVQTPKAQPQPSPTQFKPKLLPRGLGLTLIEKERKKWLPK